MPEPYILLAEDNPDDERIALRAIRRAVPDAVIKVARDGHEALDELMHEGAAMPDLVLLDVRMPKVSGFEVLEKMRKTARCKAIPVVMLTSSDEDSDIRKAYSLGANSYVQKPIDISLYMERISALCHYWCEISMSPHGRSK